MAQFEIAQKQILARYKKIYFFSQRIVENLNKLYDADDKQIFYIELIRCIWYTKFSESFSIQENVAGLDVSMYNAVTVNELKSSTHLPADT